MPEYSINWKPLLYLIDPLVWLESETDFKPYSYQTQLLRDYRIPVRVVRKSRQVGITTAIAYEAIWKAFTRSDRLILIVTPSDRQSSKVVMKRIQAVVASKSNLMVHVTQNNTTELRLDNGSVILALPNNPDRLRGFAATDIYLDEAAHFQDDGPVMAAIKPMLLATKGNLTIISTPLGKRGLFYDQYLFATNNQSSRKDVKSYDFCPSTISPSVTAEDFERWRLSSTDLEFKQEYGGEFIEQVDVYYPLDLITKCVDPSLVLRDEGKPGSEYVLGVDFAKQRDETVVILLEEEKRDGNSIFVVRHISAWAGMDYTEQLGRIRRLTKTFRVICGAADQSGVGEAVIEGLRAILPQIEGVTFTAESKVDLASTLRSFLEQKKLRLPDNRRLIMQINGLTYKISNASNLLFDSPEKERVHDDYLWALALACYAAKKLGKVDHQKPIMRFACSRME